MIPHGRPALTEDDLAALAGTSLKTWRRNEAAAFRARVPLICPGDRPRLYDREQTLAHLAGRPLPPLPGPGEHPTDLLTDREAAAVLGISDTTVRAYATTGHLSPGIELYGRRWWPRHEIDARRQAGDQRSTPRETAVRELADELAGPGSFQPTAAQLAKRDQISTRTARRRITAARRLGDGSDLDDGQ
ncbi:helix-turn-helix transcriptional regulator [Streptomyces sp. NPDC054912]